MLDLGKVKPGSKVRFPFSTFDSNDPSASVTATGLAVGDIKVFKDGGTTERASTSGYAVNADFDSLTGMHFVEIDLADNGTANFFEAGSEYLVGVADITVDAATVRAWVGRFVIGYEGALLDTTVATLASQTSFTLEDGSADDDAYNGWVAVIHDLASAVQVALCYVSDYTGSTKTVTLAADPGIFTMAAGDNISLFPPSNVMAFQGNALTITNSRPEVVTERLGTQAKADVNAEADTALSDYGANTTTPPTVGAIADAVLDEALSGHTTAGTLGKAVADIETDATAILDDTGTTLPGVLGTPAGADLAADVAAVKAETASILTDTAEIGAAGAGLTEAGGTGDHLTAITADTEDIQSRLPAALVGGRMDSDVEAINNDTDAADKLAAHALETLPVTFTGGTTTTAVLGNVDGAAASSTDDVYIGRVLVFNAGTLNHQVAEITDYTGSTKTATISAVTTAVTSSHTARMV